MICSREFSAAPLFARLERRFGAPAAARGLELRLVSSTARLRTDPILLVQILDQLVANAIAYSDGGRVLVGGRRRDDMLWIEVWDTGRGLGQEQCQRLLAPAADEAMEINQGIGLAAVGRLARLMRLPVKVASVTGGGTRIAILVPVVDGGPWGAFGLVQRRMVVVIDDDELVLEGMRMLLEAWRFDVVAAFTGEEALAHLKRIGRRPSGIIADYQLRSGRTGAEAVSRICDFYQSTIPAIIITGDTLAGRLCEAERQGAVILQKPVAAPHLHNILAQTLERRLSGV